MAARQTENQETLARWRLVLGKYAQAKMPDCLSAQQQRMAQTLDQLYSREYRGRGVRQGGPESKKGPGSLDPSQLNVPEWLTQLRELFPQETCEQVTTHAIDRYGMTELVTDPDVLASLEPSTELLSAVLSLKGQMKGRVLEEARRLVRRVVEEVKRRLEREVKNALSGRLNRFRHSLLPVARNFDARGTIRRNLKNWTANVANYWWSLHDSLAVFSDDCPGMSSCAWISRARWSTAFSTRQ